MTSNGESFEDALPTPSRIIGGEGRLNPDSTRSEVDLRKTGPRKPSASDGPARLDRLPPHSVEAEQGILGCILLSPVEIMPQAAARIVSDEVFYDLRHQTIYANMVQMFENRIGIDLITLSERLKDFDLLEQVGGIPYLASLQDSTPSAHNLEYYLGIVEEKWTYRQLIKACTETVAKIYDHSGTCSELVDEVERAILAVSRARERSPGMDHCRPAVHQAIGMIENFHQRQGEVSGIQTGFADLDKLTDGLQPGDMIVIAARPSMGKTSLAMNIAEHVTVQQRLPVGVFSLEMTKASLALRMVTSQARVNLRCMREGFLSEADFPRLTHAAGKISNAPLYIDDAAGLSILQIRSRARRAAQQFGIKLFIVDYLQLAHSTSKRAHNREQEIADISSGIKAIAKELNVPVIVLSQLNRELDKEKHRKPRLSDLRESGSIEQDADLVALLYKPKAKDDEEDDSSAGEPVNLLIAKQRNGPVGDVHLTFLKAYTRFESAAKVSDEDVPGSDYRSPHPD